MKRYRILSFDFDSRATLLKMEIQEGWEDSVKMMHYANQESMRQEFVNDYGNHASDLKLQNFIELGDLPVSIMAFHNFFLHQIRNAFVMGAFFPALTATCALGERILNRLLLLLRDDFIGTPEYKKVYNKESFDNWSTAISTLDAWGILLPGALEAFKKLSEVRNRAIHFDPEVDKNDRALALEAIQSLNTIIKEQFSAFGPQPWFITGIPGEIYLKKEAEQLPFIKKVYIPRCCLVGPRHTLEVDQRTLSFIVHDNHTYDDKEISDDEFVTFRNQIKDA